MSTTATEASGLGGPLTFGRSGGAHRLARSLPGGSRSRRRRGVLEGHAATMTDTDSGQPAGADGQAGDDPRHWFTPDGSLVTDTRGIILEADEAAALMLQCPVRMAIGKPFPLFAEQEHRAAFYRLLAAGGRSAGPAVLQVRLGGPTRKSRHVTVLVTPTAAPDAEAGPRLRWLLRDVSAARQTEAALQAERGLLDGIVDTAEAVILVVNRYGRLLRSNSYVRTVTGFAAEELEGRPWYEVLLPRQHHGAGRRLLAVVGAYGYGRSEVTPLATRAGPTRDVLWSARCVPDGRPGGDVVLLGHDVTELLQAQRQALQAERLAAIGQMAAGLAHESRNALQRSQACLSILALRLRDQAEALDLIERAQKAQDDLHRLYEGVREYAAPLRLDFAETDLAATWREAWDDLSGPVTDRRAELVEQADGVDLRVWCDHFNLKRVFRNLFENALVAGGAPPRVTVRCTPAWLYTNGDAVRVSLTDNGPGFTPEQSRQAFEPFFTTKARGTGLGLAICKRVVEAHGGRIEVAGQGPDAEVVITLPRRRS